LHDNISKQTHFSFNFAHDFVLNGRKNWINYMFFFTLQSNTILFIKIIINLNSTLKNRNTEVSQMKQTK